MKNLQSSQELQRANRCEYLQPNQHHTGAGARQRLKHRKRHTALLIMRGWRRVERMTPTRHKPRGQGDATLPSSRHQSNAPRDTAPPHSQSLKLYTNRHGNTSSLPLLLILRYKWGGSDVSNPHLLHRLTTRKRTPIGERGARWGSDITCSCHNNTACVCVTLRIGVVGNLQVRDDDGGVVDDLLLLHPSRRRLSRQHVNRLLRLRSAGDEVDHLVNNRRHKTHR